ncbi:MAG: phage tail assembly protein [Duganella sp.]
MNTEKSPVENTVETVVAVLPPNTVTLDTPLVRGNLTIDTVTLRKPTAGELRGTSLNALANLEYDAMQKVLPRISTPMLTEADVARLDPADLMQLGGVFAGFLLPKAQLASMGLPTA